MKTVTEIGVTLPQAKEYPRSPEAGQGKEGLFPRTLKESLALLDLDFRPLASRTVRE